MKGQTPNSELKRQLEKVAYIPVLGSDRRVVGIAMLRHLQQGVKIGDRIIQKSSPAFVIAEIGNNNNGSLKLAKHSQKSLVQTVPSFKCAISSHFTQTRETLWTLGKTEAPNTHWKS